MRYARLFPFCILLLPLPAVAQRPDLFALRDSLSRLTDVPSLYRLQTLLGPVASARDADEVVRRGLIDLRIYELTDDRSDSDRARAVFERGADRFPDAAWIQYGLGLVHAGAPEVRVPSPGGVLNGMTLGQSIAEILGKDPRSRARRALGRALELDPTLGAAAVLLAELAVRDGRDRDALLEARDALDRVRAAGSTAPDVARALADVKAALGDYAGAETLLAAATMPSALHARAVSLLLQPGKAESGASAYFAGVDSLDAASADRYYRDIEPIVQPKEAAEWRVADLTARRLWLARFWRRRSAESGVTEAERLAEHYGRLALARQSYLRNARRGVDGGVLLSESATGAAGVFDDRGVVLLLRGLPAAVARTTQKGVLPNETWIYRPPGESRNQLFHFVALRGSRDFTLVSDLLQALEAPALQQGDDRLRAVLTLIEDRAAYEPGYQAAAGRLRVALQNGQPLDGTEIRSIVERVDADYRRDARRALREDVYVLRFDRPLPFHFDLFSFRTPFGRTDLTAAFAIPVEAVAAVEVNGRFVYAVQISVILVDTLQGQVTRRDTVARFSVPALLQAGAFLRPHVVQAVVPTEHTVYRVVVRSPPIGAGTVYAGGTRLRELGGMGLLVSDLVLASPDSAGDWARGELRLALTLPRRFEPGRPFTLFYEVYNLAPDTPYRTRLTVDPVDRRGALDRLKGLFGLGPPRVDLRFEDRAAPTADGVVQEVRKLGTDLPPGRYRMRVVITNAVTGETAETETIFEVIR